MWNPFVKIKLLTGRESWINLNHIIEISSNLVNRYTLIMYPPHANIGYEIDGNEYEKIEAKLKEDNYNTTSKLIN